MNYNITTANERDLDFVLSLNQRSIPAVSHLNLLKLKYFLEISSYFKIFSFENKPVGFLIALLPGQDYSSENYQWVDSNFNSFLYIDRIIFDVNHRRKGFGVCFYNHLLKTFHKKIENIACEVNIKPYNNDSIEFHTKYGFTVAGEQDTESGKKRVAYMIYKII